MFVRRVRDMEKHNKTRKLPSNTSKSETPSTYTYCEILRKFKGTNATHESSESHLKKVTNQQRTRNTSLNLRSSKENIYPKIIHSLFCKANTQQR